MSAMIQVRNVPDALHRKLKSRAALEGMSLSDYLLAELRRGGRVANGRGTASATGAALPDKPARFPRRGGSCRARRRVIVVDASALLEALLQTPAAVAVEERLFNEGLPLHAPHLIDIEVTQVLRRDRPNRALSLPRRPRCSSGFSAASLPPRRPAGAGLGIAPQPHGLRRGIRRAGGGARCAATHSRPPARRGDRTSRTNRPSWLPPWTKACRGRCAGQIWSSRWPDANRENRNDDSLINQDFSPIAACGPLHCCETPPARASTGNWIAYTRPGQNRRQLGRWCRQRSDDY